MSSLSKSSTHVNCDAPSFTFTSEIHTRSVAEHRTDAFVVTTDKLFNNSTRNSRRGSVRSNFKCVRDRPPLDAVLCLQSDPHYNCDLGIWYFLKRVYPFILGKNKKGGARNDNVDGKKDCPPGTHGAPLINCPLFTEEEKAIDIKICCLKNLAEADRIRSEQRRRRRLLKRFQGWKYGCKLCCTCVVILLTIFRVV